MKTVRVYQNSMDAVEEAHWPLSMSYLAIMHHHCQMDSILQINLTKQPLYNLVNKVHLLSKLEVITTLLQNNL